MNTDNLHDILDETVQVYSQKQSRSETPTEIGTHFHPLLDRLCETAEAQNASDILISKGFPPSLKINSALTRSRKGSDGRNRRHRRIDDERRTIGNIPARRRNQLLRPIAQRHALPRQRLLQPRQRRFGFAAHQPRHPANAGWACPKTQRPRRRTAGLLIIVRYTGSGKSTTMATMLEHRNKTLPSISLPSKTRLSLSTNRAAASLPSAKSASTP